MRRFLQLLSLGLGMLVCACMADVDAPRNAPNAPTITFTDLTRVAVTLTGTYPTGADVTEYGFQWSQDGFETYKTEKNPQMTGDGSFTWTTTSLEASTSYLFRSYITNGISTRYSTNCPVNTPSTSNATLTNVTIQDGYVTASVVDPGGRNITEFGFLCGETSNKAELKRSKRQLAESTTGTTFTKALGSFNPPLDPGGTYFFLAYAEDETDAFGYSPAPQEHVVVAIRLDKSAIEFNVGDSQTLTARFLPEGTPGQSLTWASSNEEIATVTQEGVVTGVGSGTCVVKAMSGGLSDSCEVTVNAIPVGSITLDQSSAQLLPGATMALRATIEPDNATDKTVTWTSSDEEIAKVSQEGVVTAVGLGSCTITAKSGEKTVSCEITIGVPVTSVSFDESEREVYVGENFTLSASIAPADATDKAIVWKSSDETVATVSQDGAIVPKSPGTATISAAATSGAVASFDCIVVSEAPVFPDENFRKYVYDNFDTDGDGFLSRGEALSVEKIDVDTYDIESVEGIEFFVHLQFLECCGKSGQGKLKSLDVTHNPNLKQLNCGGNYLEQLDVTRCEVLELLNFSNNKLSEIDVSNNKSLRDFWCYGNQLSSIDITGNRSLLTLGCGNNLLSELDVSQNPNLRSLSFVQNKIQQIDLTGNKWLRVLDCQVNLLSEIDVSQNSQLDHIACGGNSLIGIDVSNNIKLEYLYLGPNNIDHIDLSNNKALTYLDCRDCLLTDLDLSNNKALTYIYIPNNTITNLDLSQQLQLTYLRCDNNKLVALDVSNNSSLKELNCSYNLFTSLDVSCCPNLNSLYCYSNYLDEIWLKTGQTIDTFNYFTSIATIKYKE